MVEATNRVFNRIPGTWHPSTDGQLYKQEGFNVLSTGLNASGYSYLIPNDNPTRKNRTYGHTTYMYANGERGGPLATYLVTATQRKQFTMWTNAEVRRLVRTGGHVTGVELGCSTTGTHTGFVNVTKNTGRVILAGGTFGTAKVLLRSKLYLALCLTTPMLTDLSVKVVLVRATSLMSSSLRLRTVPR